MQWQVQKACIDVGDYELVVEKQKKDWNCAQTHESWKWLVNYHGAITSQGAANSFEEAKTFAEKNVPT